MLDKVALVVGIGGQDGSYLADFLLEKGYVVNGIARRINDGKSENINRLMSLAGTLGSQLRLYEGDLNDPTGFIEIVEKIRPDEIYYLAGQSNVLKSIECPLSTCEFSAITLLKVLEKVRQFDVSPKFFHASSSEIFGQPLVIPQDESTQHIPINPYGCAKSFATNLIRVYREKFGLFAVNGILYNHESPRRGAEFVTRKITSAVAAIKLGLQNELRVGNLSSRRDWGYAPDYVEGMWRSLQTSMPDDYIFATGELHSVQEVVEIAFATLGLNWRHYTKVDLNLVRASDPSCLVGDTSKAFRILGWKPKISFKTMIEEMTLSDLDILIKRR